MAGLAVKQVMELQAANTKVSFPYKDQSQLHVGHHAKCVLFFWHLIKTRASQIFVSIWYIKIHKNPSGGRLILPSEQMDKHYTASRLHQLCKHVYK
jgi:hypothetical protein